MENELKELKQGFTDRFRLGMVSSGTLNLSAYETRSVTVEASYMEGYRALFAYVSQDTSKTFGVKSIGVATYHETAKTNVTFKVRNNDSAPQKGSLMFDIIYVKE